MSLLRYIYVFLFLKYILKYYHILKILYIYKYYHLKYTCKTEFFLIDKIFIQ